MTQAGDLETRVS